MMFISLLLVKKKYKFKHTSNISNILRQNFEHLNRHTRNLRVPMLSLRTMASISLAADAFPKLHHDHSTLHSVINKGGPLEETLDIHSYDHKRKNNLI